MTAVEVKLLGPLEVRIDERVVELRRPKQRALLALLALRAGEVVSTDRLVDELWGEAPPKAVVGSLQNLVSELRKALGPDVLLTRAPGYVLAVDRELVDAHRFERLFRETPERGAETLREALALWRGPPLAELASEPFAQAEVARLEELRAAAKEALFDVELELGRHAQLVAELEAFVGEHPLRERPRGQLMLALYRSGRQADALEAYRHARETLVEELGLEPSSALQQLEQAILRHDPSVDLERPQAKTAREPERRKTVTILFADLVDFSSLAVELDPEVLRGVLNAYFDVVRTVVERHGGTVEKFIGDAAMAAFGIPEVHEDDALRAVRAASELQEALGELHSQHGVELELRVGVNTGEVLTADPSSGESFATGGAVVLATRLQEAAQPGETLVGETTYKLVRDAATAEAVEPIELGRVLGRVPAFRFLGFEDDAAGLQLRRTAPLVGRADELARLRALFAGVQSERRSRVVTLLGEAGIGKTRLAAELVSSAGATVLVGRCAPYGEGASYLPLVQAVRQAVPTRVRASVASLLAGDENAELVAQRIAELIGDAEGTASTGELFWAVRRFFEALARKRPVLLVFDDVHWAEPTLLDLIEYLSAWAPEAPVLVLCIARPEVLEKRPGWADANAIRLDPLSADESARLVEELAEVPHDVRSRIVDVAEGNALYLEQLLAYVVEDEASEAIESLPPSIDALLASRIERLEPEERAVLERAAVVGKEFTRSSVLHLTPPDHLPIGDGCLATLRRKGLILALPLPQSDDNDSFRFYHALIRDVAYAGITKETRAELHERHATWLAQRDGLDEIIGYHLEQAHRYRSELRPGEPGLAGLAQRAGEHLANAGLRAFKRADTSAAVSLLGRAVALLPSDDPRRLEALCELGNAQHGAGDVAAGEATLGEAVARAQEAADRRFELRARMERSYLRLFTDREADVTELFKLAHDANPVFEQLGDDRALGRTWRHIGYARGSMEGRCAEWLEASERALVYYRRSGWSAAGCLGSIGAALYYGPTPVPEGVDRCEELLTETTDRLGTANVLTFLGGLHALADRFEDGFAFLAEANTIYREIDALYMQMDDNSRVLGRTHRLAGDSEAAERVFRECGETFERVGNAAGLASVAAELGQSLYAEQRYSEASDWCRLAEKSAPSGDVAAQFAWRGLRGRLLAREGLIAEGETLAVDAIRIAEQTDALTHHGEALLDLAEVLRLGERHAEAAARIEEALALFDAKENAASARLARSLLAELTVV
jgi:class 3 adenylate cyclase/tetratricopeptide (TPR) repeat protein